MATPRRRAKQPAAATAEDSLAELPVITSTPRKRRIASESETSDAEMPTRVSRRLRGTEPEVVGDVSTIDHVTRKRRATTKTTQTPSEPQESMHDEVSSEVDDFKLSSVLSSEPARPEEPAHAEESSSSHEPASIGEDKKSEDKKSATSVKIIRGRPKSGRVWKSEHQRFKTMIDGKHMSQPFKQRQIQEQELKAIKDTEKQLKDARIKQKEDARKRIEEQRKRREENERRSEIVQVITKTQKIKKMSRKQLRQIIKRDVTTQK